MCNVPGGVFITAEWEDYQHTNDCSRAACFSCNLLIPGIHKAFVLAGKFLSRYHPIDCWYQPGLREVHQISATKPITTGNQKIHLKALKELLSLVVLTAAVAVRDSTYLQSIDYFVPNPCYQEQAKQHLESHPRRPTRMPDEQSIRSNSEYA